jgi:hypothetical protein
MAVSLHIRGLLRLRFTYVTAALVKRHCGWNRRVRAGRRLDECRRWGSAARAHAGLFAGAEHAYHLCRIGSPLSRGGPPGPRGVDGTGAGEENAIDHNTNCLRFPYDSTFLRSHSPHSHPYPLRTAGGPSRRRRRRSAAAGLRALARWQLPLRLLRRRHAARLPDLVPRGG